MSEAPPPQNSGRPPANSSAAPKPEPFLAHGGRIVARALKAEGVEHVFTLCGGHIQHIYDGCIDEGIRVVDVRHEQTAGHAADGYARVTGRPGVALVTAGPGVTDVVTAVANAQRSGVPMVVIGGAGPFALKHKGSLQDMDHVELMRPITKWSAAVTETRRLEEFVAMAFRHAIGGVPGPVFLEVPLDILMGMEKVPPTLPNLARNRGGFAAAADPDAIDRAAMLLQSAEKPMLIVGSQIRWTRSARALSEFLDVFPVPTFLNGMARGELKPDHPCFLSRTRRNALAEADVVLVCGTPFDFRLGYGNSLRADAQVIHVDRDATALGHNRGIDVGIVGDTGLVLDALSGVLQKRAPGEWMEQLRGTENEKQAHMQEEAKSDASPVNPLRVCAEVARYVDDKTIVIGDGGDFVATAAYMLPIQRPGLWMDPGPLGTLGVGPGYAMAAKLARPESKVILMYGDGSFGLHAMEWEAMARQGINVIGIVGNDAGWTQILRGQREMFGEERVVATRLDFTHYEKVVEACGGKGFYAETPDQLSRALENAFAAEAPCLVNVKIGSSDFRKGAISV